jgi:hypothetical protein
MAPSHLSDDHPADRLLNNPQIKKLSQNLHLSWDDEHIGRLNCRRTCYTHNSNPWHFRGIDLAIHRQPGATNGEVPTGDSTERQP